MSSANTMFRQKVGIAAQQIAAQIIPLDVGNRVPTVSDWTLQLGVARGTIQTAIQYLRDSGAVKLQFRGKKGSYIVQMDRMKLTEIAGLHGLIGVMPLPYSKKYEGLATGIYNVLNDAGLNTNLAFMRGSDNRLRTLMQERCDFAVMSELTAEYYIKMGYQVAVVLNLGNFSYVDKHVVLVRKDFKGHFNGLKVGVDNSSIDQKMMTASFFERYNVTYVPLIYSDIIASLRSRKIDAAVWNFDNINFSENELSYLPISQNELQIADTRAVILCRQADTLVCSLLGKNVNAQSILEYQRDVLVGRMTPRY
ncbi:MAG: hypothetical protein GX939_03350 [Clostridiaceae bacterium]|jgi:hypothetical protein|nr:hypothetical protein [Clostridiaceae bacterium]